MRDVLPDEAFRSELSLHERCLVSLFLQHHCV